MAIFWGLVGDFGPKIGDFGPKVPSDLPVAGLFKSGQVRFFGDPRRISPHVFSLFPKIVSEACTRPLKMAENPKNGFLVT